MSVNSRQVVGAFLTVALSWGSSAAAHSTKEKTEPADGAVITTAPTTIGMTFDSPMRVTMITLTDAEGGEYPVDRTDGMVPVMSFTADVPPLQRGTYTVEWRGLADDGHAMDGSFSFKIGD
ncbi:MAG: copper resistance CopC family protein [Pseudomonadota bacterium]